MSMQPCKPWQKCFVAELYLAIAVLVPQPASANGDMPVPVIQTGFDFAGVSGHRGIQPTEVSADRRYLITQNATTMDTSVWDLATGFLAFDLPRHKNAQISPDGLHIATIFNGVDLQVREIGSLAVVLEIQDVRQFRYSGDGHWLIVVSDRNAVARVPTSTKGTGLRFDNLASLGIASLTVPECGGGRTLSPSHDGAVLLCDSYASSMIVRFDRGTKAKKDHTTTQQSVLLPSGRQIFQLQLEAKRAALIDSDSLQPVSEIALTQQLTISPGPFKATLKDGGIIDVVAGLNPSVGKNFGLLRFRTAPFGFAGFRMISDTGPEGYAVDSNLTLAVSAFDIVREPVSDVRSQGVFYLRELSDLELEATAVPVGRVISLPRSHNSRPQLTRRGILLSQRFRDRIRVANLTTGKVVVDIDGLPAVDWKGGGLSPSGVIFDGELSRGFYWQEQRLGPATIKLDAFVIDAMTRRTWPIATFDYVSDTQFAFSPGGTYLLAWGHRGATVFDAAAGKIVMKVDGRVNCRFTQDDRTLACSRLTRDGAHKQSIDIFGLPGGALQRSIEFDAPVTNSAPRIEVSPGGSKIWVGDTNFLRSEVIDLLGRHPPAVLSDKRATPRWRSDDLLEVGSTVLDYSGGKGIVLPSGGASAVPVSTTMHYRLIDKQGGVTDVIDAVSQKKLATIVAGVEDWVVLSPEGYYTTPRGTTRLVAFRHNGRTYGFEEFDLRFNRPDLVRSNLGAPNRLIEALRRAHAKRVQRMGQPDDAPRPRASIDMRELPIQTKSSSIPVGFTAQAPAGRPAVRYQVYVNGVPTRGVSGAPLTGERTTDQVDLSAGANRIQVSVFDDRGVESLRDTWVVNNLMPKQPVNRYVLGIGVSRYADPSLNLDFAAKDAHDFAGALQTGDPTIKRTFVKLLTDGDAVREAIRESRQFFASASPEDQAIVFLAGHGLLDMNDDYFFATHDIDPNAPAARGMRLSEIEDLFSETKARRRLLVIDTCHSGEVDRDMEGRIKSLPKGVTGSRGLKSKTGAGRSPDSQDVSVYVSELFSDIRRGIGATMFASAGGIELAHESGALKNGLFTYALIEALANPATDTDGSSSIELSELRDRAGARVTSLSSGLQVPNTRVENADEAFSLRSWSPAAVGSEKTGGEKKLGTKKKK